MEWLANNIVGMVLGAAGWLSTIMVVIWKLSGIAATSRSNGERMEALAKAFKEHEDDFDRHTSDASVHTTFEQRMAINARFDRIESSIERGHANIESKIDRMTERLLNKR